MSILSSGTSNTTALVYTSDTTGNLVFQTNGTTEAMRITTGGNVGIGTTTPNLGGDTIACTLSSGTSGSKIARYEIQGTRDDGDNVFAAFDFYQKANLVASILSRKVTGDTGGDLEFLTRTNGGSLTERMRITTAGDLLVSTTDPANSSGIGVKIAGVNSGPYVSVVSSSSSGSAFGIGLYSTGASAFRFYADCGGTIHATSTSIAAISDASLKENIKDLETGLTEVIALKPRRFDWINGDATNVAGFIAQEVETILPELVMDSLYSKDEEGNEIYKKNLKMGDILPTLVKAIQELNAKVDAQAAEIAALKGNN